MMYKTREKRAASEDAGVDCGQQKDTDTDPYVAKEKENYDPDKVFGYVRREQLKAAA